MAERDRQNQREIQDEATRRNIDPGTGGTGGALDMGMTTGDQAGVSSEDAARGSHDVSARESGSWPNRPGRGPEAGRGGDADAGGSTDVGGSTASGAGGGNVMGGSGTRTAAGGGERSTGDIGFDVAGGGDAPTGGTGGGTGSGADMKLTNLDTPGTTVRGRQNADLPGGDAAAGQRKGVDDDRPNTGDASDQSAFDASNAYAGIDSDDALPGGEGSSGTRSRAAVHRPERRVSASPDRGSGPRCSRRAAGSATVRPRPGRAAGRRRPRNRR